MSKINFSNVYKDRIIQIDEDIKKCIHEKKWTQVAKLKAEKSRLEEYVSNE